MNKWIAEFELEDGDTMPEHMDLEYKGAKIDFHCRPMWGKQDAESDVPDRNVGDLISRQAAIDAINQICPIDTEYDCTLLDRVDVRCVLTDLPSAQPEIIRCKDCKHFAGEWMYCACDIIVQFDHFYCYHAERRQDV